MSFQKHVRHRFPVTLRQDLAEMEPQIKRAIEAVEREYTREFGS